MEVRMKGKTATLNLRVNPEVKENAENVLAQLGIPMATAIDMYLKQIALVGGIPFSVVLPKAASTVNADMMYVEQIHQKLEKGYADIEKGNVEDAASAFAAFRERH
ncbi:MAG: type II toxin-antitoxin system RelB/DinJ family antitoxin [Lachnospiraceae bacterium]|nr:type II toxin-antitoxin system RelB/DinJ family antitoxin [Lachnospiraceae bacterium]